MLDKEAMMAVAVKNQIKAVRAAPVPRALRARVENLLEENYAFMDSPIFRQRNIEK